MKIPSGIPGLDEILRGGLNKGWTYLVKGEAGCGKTIFGLQFLLEGVRNKEKCIFISFDETLDEITAQAENFNWNVEDIIFVDKVKDMDILAGDITFYDFDTLSELQKFLDSIIKLKEIEQVDRVFIDGAGAIGDVIKDRILCRRVFSSLINFFNSMSCTTIISTEIEAFKDGLLSYLTSGEFILEKVKKENEEVIRTINVSKYRGGKVYLGRHYFEINESGIEIYPIIPVLKKKKYSRVLISTGDKNLDSMLGGGIYKGSRVLIAGKSGVGKTLISMQILKENDRRGSPGLLYSFEESESFIEERFLGIFNHVPSKIVIKDLSETTNPGKIYKIILDDVKAINPEIVVLDPVNYLEEQSFSKMEFKKILSLILSQLSNAGITTICTYEVSQPLTEFHFTGVGLSRFADYLIIGKYMEIYGELLKTIAVMKNKFGNHERTFRVLNVKKGKGLEIGPPLKEWSGIITGMIEKKRS